MTSTPPGTAELDLLSDAELIVQYQSLLADDQPRAHKAFEVLVRRHYNAVYKRLLARCKNEALAFDLCQKLWLKVLENLESYTETQRFPNFLNTIASNLLKDEWKRKSNQLESSLESFNAPEEANNSDDWLLEDKHDLEASLIQRSEVSYLVNTLIPALPVKLRAVFLLRHESEYWDSKQPLQWQHLADMNATSIEDVSQRFLDARDQLLLEPASALDEQDRMIFVCWSQAKRWDKSAKHTEAYLSQLLNIPVNTFKTRYRKALAQLSDGLAAWRKTQ